MDRRFLSRRTVAIGVFGLAVALAVPLIAKSVAGADPSDVVPPVQPQHTSRAQSTEAEPADAQPAQPQAARSIVYGTATETTVTVYRQALPSGAPEALFTYENVPRPEVSEQALGDPDLALSADGRSVAYFARSGVRIRHLDTGADDVVIGRTDPPPGGDRPTWTLGELNPPAGADPLEAQWASMYSLHQLTFSPDGRFLSFAGHWYEYSDHLVIELATGRHWRDNGSRNLAWSPSSDRVAVAGPWYADDGELAVSAPGDFGRYTKIRPAPRPIVDASYEDVEFSPAGDRIAFLVSDRSWPTAETELGVSKLDGAGYATVKTAELMELFAFSPDGGTLYSLETRQDGLLRVEAHDLSARRSRDVATVPADFVAPVDFWVTPSGELAVVAATPDEGHGVFNERLFLFASDGRLLDQSPAFDATTRFLGIG